MFELKFNNPWKLPIDSFNGIVENVDEKTNILQNWNVAITSDGKLCVCAHKREILVIKQNQPTQLIRFPTHCSDEDQVTQILFLPLFYNKETRFCVVAGYKSGIIRFFSSSGILLLAQWYSKREVVQLKLRTCPMVEGSLGQQTEDLLILYGSSFVTVIDGLSLSTSLQSCFITLEKGFGQESLSQNSLSYRKWELQPPDTNSSSSTSSGSLLSGVGPSSSPNSAQNSSSGHSSPANFNDSSSFAILDVATAGIMGSSPNGILHPLRTTSNFRLIAVGQAPMLSCYVPTEEQSISLRSAVTKASKMATKLTSAVFSYAKNWLSGGSQTTETSNDSSQSFDQDKIPIDIQKFIPIQPKFHLSDIRQVTSVLLEPLGRMALICDTFGRIILVDLEDNLIVKIWKGYREPQVAFIEPPQTQRSKSTTDSTPIVSDDLYVVLYTGRRGIMEVWNLMKRERVSIADVGIACKLLNTSTPLGEGHGQYRPAKSYLLSKDCVIQEIVLAKSTGTETPTKIRSPTKSPRKNSSNE